MPEFNEYSTIAFWESSSSSDDTSDSHDWIFDSLMSASPIDQPAPIDIVVEPVSLSDDR